nr:MAG TPA: hypothetical protein [Caudoviricetes sp.]
MIVKRRREYTILVFLVIYNRIIQNKIYKELRRWKK